MQKFLFILLCSIIVWFHFQAKYGRGGEVDDQLVMAQIKQQKKLNHDFIERNNQMVMQIAGLKGSTDSIEQRSRTEFNMIKKGETLVMLPEDDLDQEKKSK